MTDTLAPTRRRRRLGEILIELGALDDDTLQRVLARQRSSGRRLGEILLEDNVIRPVQLLQALAAQYELEFVDLNTASIDLAITAMVPEQLARRYRAVAIGRDANQYVVAMANPADVFALDDLRLALRGEIKPVLADPDQILDLLHRSGPSDSLVQDAIRMALDEQAEDEPVDTAARIAVDDAPLVRFVDLLIARAVQERASDIHIDPTSAGLRIRFRIDGVMREAMHPPKSLQAGIISRIKVMADIDIAERRLPQDGRVTLQVGERPIDLRIATVPTVNGEAAVLRLLARNTRGVELAELGFLPDQLARYQSAYRRPWGALFVTGPTGSGKTTTLYGTLRELNDPTRNIITIEDPVEYRIDGIKQMQVNTKAGLTFATALRNMLRADPDVMLVGEIRDRETAVTAVEAALTGHLVLSTLHTNDAASTPLRLLEMGVEPFLVTSAVHAVLAQRLCRRLCERCREATAMSDAEAELLRLPWHLRGPDDRIVIYRAHGCQACNGTGYRGRFALHEVLLLTEEVKELVLRQAPAEEIVRVAVGQGMVPLREDGYRKVKMGLTSLEELARVVN